MKQFLMATGLSVLLATAVVAQTSSSATGPFLISTAQAANMEIALATMAQSQAGSARVKAYARMLESDHRQAAQQLDVMASMKGIALPANQPMDAILRLQKVKGSAFDQAYIDQMIADHVQAIRNCEQAVRSADADVKAFAERRLPTLQKHLVEAQTIKKSL